MFTKQTNLVAGANCSAIIFLQNKKTFCTFALENKIAFLRYILVSKYSPFRNTQENSQFCGSISCVLGRAIASRQGISPFFYLFNIYQLKF